MISGSGPGLALTFFMVVPFIISVPTSLAAAEMTTIMPVEGGFYRWSRAALGDFWGFQCGWWNWTGSFLLSAAYLVPKFSNSPWTRPEELYIGAHKCFDIIGTMSNDGQYAPNIREGKQDRHLKAARTSTRSTEG
jgi:amino acid transporter